MRSTASNRHDLDGVQNELRYRLSARSVFQRAGVAAAFFIIAASQAFCADPSDPIINLFVQKGIITESEAAKAKAEIEAIRTNQMQMPPMPPSKWKLSDGIKKIELYGDIRARFESRSIQDPSGGHIDLDRYRYAVRLGLRGEVFDDFYYGLRLDTSSNPRSSWVTFGSSSSSTPYQGPFGKSTATIAVGQAYLGWHPSQWLDLTIGKMPNPLFTTPLVWDSDLNPEGAAERFKLEIGQAEVFATLGQFIYQDVNPFSASGGLGFNGLLGQHSQNVFLLTWQAGLKYQFTTNMSAKAAATLYTYNGLQRSSLNLPSATSPYFGDPYIGEGAYLGPGSGTKYGYSGYGTSFGFPGYSSVGFPLNQVGLDHLMVIEVPFEFNFKVRKLDARLFADVAYNLEGNDRAKAAANGYKVWLANQPTTPTVKAFAPQGNENTAYQAGLAFGNFSPHARHPWEFRTFWQHTEQYSLDPNLIDSDTFEGRENLEGFNVQLSYGLTPNFIGSARYARATRINDKLGTGGSNQDIPQINPINKFDLLQFDLTFKF
jgi:Putative porin